MKYREEFEAWFADYCCMSPSERDRFFSMTDLGGYFLGETIKRHDAFAAGYEAALKKGRDDGIV